MRKRRIELVDAQKLIRVAIEYHVNERKQADIAAEIGVNQSTIAHWLALAHERGIVAIDIDPDFALAGTEDLDLSKRLRDAFNLRDCFVVDPGEWPNDDQKTDTLHTIIANTVGQKLKEWIQAGDHIAIGGGRAPTKVARFIRRTAPRRRDIRISPLSGRIWTGSWQEDGPENLQRPLDADDAARLLALAYEHEPGTRFSQIGHPLYAENDEIAKLIVREECAFNPGGSWKTEWGTHLPGRALVGVGVLHPDSGHRINELLQGTAKRRPRRHLTWAAGKYRDTMKFAKTAGLENFGDVANRLFAAVPLPGKPLAAAKLYAKLQAMLDEINARAIVMEWEHLRKIPSVWAVAGGALKTNVIWTLLISRHLEADKSQSVIKELTVDRATAQRLVHAFADFENASAVTRDWYAEVCGRIFSPAGR